MNVLQLTTNADATYLTNQVESLAAHGVESEVVEVPTRSDRSGRGPFDYARFCADVRRRIEPRHDLIHANYGLTIPAAACQRGLPVVSSLVGTDLMGSYGALTKWLTRLCDEVIVVSAEMNALLPGEAAVIPYGVDLDQFHPMDRTRARDAVGWDADDPTVMFPYSRDRAVKNYPLADAVVDAASQRLGREIRLEVVTGCDHEMIPYYMNAADALLLTSHREGSPSTVKEALACDTPVVATPVGDVPERLAPVERSAVGENVDDLVNGLCRVLESDGPTGGRRAVEDLRLERSGERILSVYDRVLE